MNLGVLLYTLREYDLLIITADHGNDPTYTGTDHTREQVPVLMFGRQVAPRSLGRRATYADLGQSIAAFLDIAPLAYGESFLK